MRISRDLLFKEDFEPLRSIVKIVLLFKEDFEQLHTIYLPNEGDHSSPGDTFVTDITYSTNIFVLKSL